MTKAEAYVVAWRVGVGKKDFSIVDQIYHSEYKSIDHLTSVEVSLQDEKAQITAFDQEIIIGPFQILAESEDFLKIKYFSRLKNEEAFALVESSITYKEKKIITQQSTMEDLDYDPSEGQDWKWEDYE